MAAAEVRTAWQRMANRFFVQEDAKRAPKFACCPPSASKLQSESSNGDVTNEKDHSFMNFAHVNWSSNPNFSPDSKWWLQVPPNMGYQKPGWDQSHLSEHKLEDKSAKKVNPTPKSEQNHDIGTEMNAFQESPTNMSHEFAIHKSEMKTGGLKSANISPEFLKQKLNLHDHWYEGDETMDWKVAKQLIPGKRDDALFDVEPHWTSNEKAEPWWKISDKEELASFVAKKSLEHFDNCDLPRPWKMHTNRGAVVCFENIEDDGGLPPSLGGSLYPGICIPSKHTMNDFSGSMGRNHPSSPIQQPFSDANRLHSLGHVTAVNTLDKREHSNSSADPSKSELLEALCHSQTRARKAEIAAQKAYNDKEHVIKLLFRQASYLFAYKQWLRLLQLERLHLQVEIKKQESSSRTPAAKADQLKETGCKDDQRKGKEPHSCGICGFLIAFAVGFSFASVGLLLGWAFGCLLSL